MWIFTSSIFFLHQFLLVWFFYSNIILKLDFGYIIFVFEGIMFLFSNFFVTGLMFFYTKYYLKNSFFVIIFLVTFVISTPIFYWCVFFTQILSLKNRFCEMQ